MRSNGGSLRPFKGQPRSVPRYVRMTFDDVTIRKSKFGPIKARLHMKRQIPARVLSSGPRGPKLPPSLPLSYFPLGIFS